MRKLKGKLAVMMAAGVTAAWMLGTPDAYAASKVDTALNASNQAANTVRDNERAVRDEASKTNASIDTASLNLKINSVKVVGNHSMGEKRILDLLPELSKETANVRMLSKQIQMANDTGALSMKTVFTPNAEGGYDVTVNVEEKDPDKFIIGVSNTGNEYTGNWRTSLSYINTNASQNADTIGLAYVTSPAHWSDVKQAAFSYRRLLPKASSSIVFGASYSDVSLGSVSSYAGLFDLNASGTGATVGMHYQYNLAYTSREKDIWDVGIDYRRSDNDYDWRSQYLSNTSYDYHTDMLSLAFIHNNRSEHDSFTYTLGYATNLDGSKEDYEKATPGSDHRFNIWKAGASYQYKTPSDWIIGARAYGQYTNNNIVSMEQFGAGGQSSVRGFDERVISSDYGYMGSLEIYTPQVMKNSRFVLFYDAAKLFNNNSYSSLYTRTLSSYGIGYRLNDIADGISLAVDYAIPASDIDHRDLGERGHKRWNMSLSYSF
ncbi:MAG: ShlB/FhaC/HecB family hemolysin secretion/activation protein [Selenomonadaceae bacterium]